MKIKNESVHAHDEGDMHHEKSGFAEISFLIGFCIIGLLETVVLACEKPDSVAARADRMLTDDDKPENIESKAVLYSNGERSITVLSALSNDNADKPFLSLLRIFCRLLILDAESNLGSSTSSEQNDQMHTIVLDDAIADHHVTYVTYFILF
jgi:hypothetical protein